MFDCEWKFLRYILRISFYDHFELNKTKPNGIVLANDKRSVKNYDVLKNIYSLWSLRWLWLLNIKVGGQTRYTSLTIRDFIFHGKYLNKYWVIKCVILTNFLWINLDESNRMIIVCTNSPQMNTQKIIIFSHNNK